MKIYNLWLLLLSYCNYNNNKPQHLFKEESFQNLPKLLYQNYTKYKDIGKVILCVLIVKKTSYLFEMENLLTDVRKFEKLI